MAKEAAKFKSKITLKNLDTNSEEKNAKSILTILTLGISTGTNIRLAAEGEDEKEAAAKLLSFIESGLGE